MSEKNKKLLKTIIFSTLMRSFEIVRSQAVKARIDNKKTSLLIIKPKMNAVIDSFKFTQVKKLIASGEDATKRALTRLKKLQ